MLGENLHPTDQELLLAADGELSSSRGAEVHAHLSSCWHCRERMAEVEKTVFDFVRVHRGSLDPQIPDISGPRASLRAQLAELASSPDPAAQQHLSHFPFARRAATYLYFGLLAAAAILFVATRQSLFHADTSPAAGLASAAFDSRIVPDRKLTPGALRPVSVSDVCSMPHEEVEVAVPSSLRRKILQEYGIGDGRASDYEIDYLIAPGLGGTEDIRNLWPEPYASATWNAHVKDNLEEHLHELVCSGQVQLSTAQKDIATDWIAAYKKYFNTDKPLALPSDLLHTSDNTRSPDRKGFIRPSVRQLSVVAFYLN
jgi:anti-sigma factor RsiW